MAAKGAPCKRLSLKEDALPISVAAFSWAGQGCPLELATGVGDPTQAPKFKVGRGSAGRADSGDVVTASPAPCMTPCPASRGASAAAQSGSLAVRMPSARAETVAPQVPLPFKAGVASKLTFYWKAGDFKAGLAGVSMQVQGVKAAQASGVAVSSASVDKVWGQRPGAAPGGTFHAHAHPACEQNIPHSPSST